MAGDNEKKLQAFKQDLLGFVSQLAGTVKNHADRFDLITARYDSFFQNDYKKCASLKSLEAKKAMLDIPATIDPRNAKSLDQTIEKANRENQTPDADPTPKHKGPNR